MIKLFSAFSGIGAYENALRRIGQDYDLVNYCEIDKYASKAYSILYDVDESLNLGDITKVDETKLPDFDLFTWSFPCTSLSVAGNQKGLIDDDGNKTASGLYFDGMRILRHKKPKVSIIENVKNLVGNKFKKEFEMILNDFDEAGYNTYYAVLNSKDFEVPQSRERVYIISVRKDIDLGLFEFPEGKSLTLRLKDILEDKVDEKFYISQEKVERFIKNINGKLNMDKPVLGTCHERNDLSFATRDRVYNPEMEAPTLTATMYKDAPKVIQIGNCMPGTNRANPNQGRVYDKDGISPALTTMSGGSRQPMIITLGNVNPSQRGMNGNVYSSEGLSPTLTTNKGEGLKITEPLACASRGRYNKDGSTEQRLEINDTGCSNALTTVQKDNYILEPNNVIVDDIYNNRDPRIYEEYSPTIRAERQGLKTIDSDLRIRKLTPRECWRLQGFTDEDFDKVNGKISNTQLYRQSGNTVTVTVLEAIFKNLFEAVSLEDDQVVF